MFSRRAFLTAAALTPFPATWALAQNDDDGAQVDPAVLEKGATLKDIWVGDAKAPVKVYEYASMTCTHCANFATTVFPTIKTKYIDTGKVYWAIREFPSDPVAAAAFMLARCSGDDKYYAMLDVLFSQQKNWAFVDTAQILPSLLQIARQAGFSEERFNSCLADKELYAGINNTRNYGINTLNISGTPTFFINGKRKNGEVTVEQFAELVDPLLK